MARKPAPGFIPPQLATLRDRPPNGAAWIHEIKFDGYRLQLSRATTHGPKNESQQTTRLLTRNGIDWTVKFPEIAKLELPDCIIDGELTALDENGAPSFAALQSAIAGRRTAALVYFAFDLLSEGGKDLRGLPLIERKKRLEKLLKPLGKTSRIRFVEHLTGDSATILAHVGRLGLEGLVSKRADSRYISRRTQSWIKVKCWKDHEVLIGGWIERRGTLATFLIGERDGKKALHYAGRLGAAIPVRRAREVLARLRELEQLQSPFAGGDLKATKASVRWAKPQLKAVISYLTRTRSGSLRHHTIREIVEVAQAATTGRKSNGRKKSRREQAR